MIASNFSDEHQVGKIAYSKAFWSLGILAQIMYPARRCRWQHDRMIPWVPIDLHMSRAKIERKHVLYRFTQPQAVMVTGAKPQICLLNGIIASPKSAALGLMAPQRHTSPSSSGMTMIMRARNMCLGN
jgi:hypothetical protein